MDVSQLLEAAQIIGKTNRLIAQNYSSILPAVTAIFGALAGGFATFIATYFIDKHRNRIEKQNIKCALVAEIRAIIEISSYRNYYGLLTSCVNTLRQNPDTVLQFSIKIPIHYSRIYQNNLDRLGVLDKRISSKIIIFHQLIDSIVQDVTPGGIICEHGGRLEQFEEILAIAEEAKRIASDLLANDRP